MKLAVIVKTSVSIRAALGTLAKCAGIASYVTLVWLLTQKNLADLGAKADLAAREQEAQATVMLAAQRTHQTTFVSKIIELHTPNRHNTQGLAELIVGESEKASYDPLFVAAVIRSESMFRHGAISSRGAKGLMQIMPATGKYISQREKIVLTKSEDLHDPVTNIRLGIAYLKYLDKKFHGNREHVLIAYNWGPANLMLSMRGAAKPPAQSVKYAKTILTAHRQWNTELNQLAALLSPASKTAMVG